LCGRRLAVGEAPAVEAFAAGMPRSALGPG
jgi:hypothetical protein